MTDAQCIAFLALAIIALVAANAHHRSERGWITIFSCIALIIAVAVLTQLIPD